MNNIVIYGAGGFGRETGLLIDQINRQSAKWNVLGFCDDGKSIGEVIDGLPVLGGMDYLNASPQGLSVIIAIADPSVREKIRQQLIHPKLEFPALIHPSVTVSETCAVGEGCIICSDVVMTVNVTVQPFTIVNLKCTLGHDCVLGKFSSLMPAVNISGNVVVGRGVYVGAGAILLQGVAIGDHSLVGAGAVVNKSFESGKRIIGVPARAI
ncbi:MAG TPA: NeuD/PglB/VioB family sugar acetyltransferase [Cyclobacteriaceae bacterium]|jgi:sugar O-acyltransferase (sialic acid O-acetyltransferase NeuD family)|nr:NeuD/PglB/VioB family sugar acetyltransferase [Cyclobacteriaceae bacterium]